MDFFNKIEGVFFIGGIAVFFLFATSNTYAQKKIEGVWKSEDGKYMMKVASFGSDFQGRIVWMEEENDATGEPKLDTKNPDEKLRKLPIKGSKILKNLTYNASGGNWIGGILYLPETGRQYKCKAEIRGGKLIITYENGNTNKNWTWVRNS